MFATKSEAFLQVEAGHTAKLIELLGQGGIDTEDLLVERMSSRAAFCNTVYRVESGAAEERQIVIAKIFSDLALRRMDPEFAVGEIDRIVSQHGQLVPEILATSACGILMENCHGSVLTQETIHKFPAKAECVVTARSLAHLHSIPLTRQKSSKPAQQQMPISDKTNMLWRACDVMLDLSEAAGNPLPYSRWGWSIGKLREHVEHHKFELNKLSLPLVDIGHGDCKPGNVFYTQSPPSAKFIDMELAGTHYRAFDLAKFFRTDDPTQSTQQNKSTFLHAYCEGCPNQAVEIKSLREEVDLLLPMTWLEAAIFFVCMASSCKDQAQLEFWNNLASNRLSNYERAAAVY